MSDFIKTLSILIFLFVSPLISAYQVRFTPTSGSVDIPVGWGLRDSSEPGRASFSSLDSSIIFQITAYPGELYRDDREMMEVHLQELEVLESDFSRFLYLGRSVSLAECTFNSSGAAIHGWFLFVERDDYDYYLTVITPESLYQESFPWMISCLDGFSPNQEGRSLPGPVSTMFSTGEKSVKTLSVNISGKRIPFSYNSLKNQAVQLLIEREAAILSTYTEPDEFSEAWKRHYQQIYRVSQSDLEPLSQSLQSLLKGQNPVQKSEILLTWLQDFTYGSSDSFSDLLSPLSVLQTHTGDCDALALVYNILLQDLNIPALLMVSYVYSHSMGAVGVEKDGAGFEYNGYRYIVAEMTKKVDLGLISQDMAAIENWVIISPSDPEYHSISIIQ